MFIMNSRVTSSTYCDKPAVYNYLSTSHDTVGNTSLTSCVDDLQWTSQ